VRPAPRRFERPGATLLFALSAPVHIHIHSMVEVARGVQGGARMKCPVPLRAALRASRQAQCHPQSLLTVHDAALVPSLWASNF
jgi:hypothetical protein